MKIYKKGRKSIEQCEYFCSNCTNCRSLEQAVLYLRQMRRILLGIYAAVLISCIPSEKHPESEKMTLIGKAEKAHSKRDFLANEVMQFDIVLEFGGTERLNGAMALATNSSKGRISYKNGRELYYDHERVFASPELENTGGARFAAYTWSYFFLFPYKLSDPGTNWSASEVDTLKGQPYHSQRLTFEKGVGDAPDDWYISYFNTETNLIEAAAYIVTAGETTVEEAEENPHAISYHDYKDVDGIALAHSWKFWEWRKDSGLTRQLGKAELSNFQFLTDEEASLNPPENFIEIE